MAHDSTAGTVSLVLGFLGCLATPACEIETPTLPDLVDAGTPAIDAGPDAGPADGGSPDCRIQPGTCDANRFCASDGTCQPVDRPCDDSHACAPGDVCVIGPMATTSTAAGRCGDRPGRCTPGADCPGGVCWAIGLCGPRTTSAEVVAGELLPVAHCTTGSDCGPGGLCRNQRCAACLTRADCPGELRCGEAGRCVEAATCQTDAQCFPANTCAAGSRCARRTDGCQPDPANDDPASAQEIGPGVYLERSICGDDEDWYAVELTEGQGVRFVVVTEPDAFTPVVTVRDPAGEQGEHVNRIELPGRTAVDVSGVNVGEQNPRKVLLGVASRDQSGAYTLHVDVRAGACAADTLDLYGEEPPSSVPTNVQFDRRLCPLEEDTVTFGVQTGDRIEATATPRMGVVPTLQLTGGSTGAQAAGRVVAGPYTDSAQVTLTARLGAAPSAGQRYTVALDRSLGTRFNACRNPPPLVSGQPETVNLATAVDLGLPRCPAGPEGAPGYAPPARHDAVFLLDVETAPALVTATAVQTAGSAARVAIAALTQCTDERSTRMCDVSPLPRRAAELEFVAPDAGPVFLLVSSDAGREDVQVELTARAEPLSSPANDLCVNATSLAGADRLDSSTYGAANNDELLDDVTCGSAGIGRGPDRFYSLTVPGQGRAAVELYGPRGSFLWAGRRCDLMTATCTAAQARDDTNQIPKLTFSPRVQETYFIAVDGRSAQDVGRSELRVIERAECLDDDDCGSGLACDDYVCRIPPSNDDCPGQVVTLDANGFARRTGSTGAARDALSLSCVANPRLPDVVYGVEVPEGSSEFTARVVDATFDPALGVRLNLCSSPVGEFCNDDLQGPDAYLPEVRIEEPTAGFYYVVVDGQAGRGTFTLELQVR